MKKAIERDNTLLKLFYFFRNFGCGFFSTLFQLFLNHKGLSTSYIGYIYSIQTAVGFISSLFFSYYCKNANVNRKILKVLTIVEGIAFMSFFFADGFEVIAICCAFSALATWNAGSLIDGFSENYTRINNKSQASIRFYGSLSYLIAAFFSGMVAKYIGYDAILFLSGIPLLIASTFIYIIKPVDVSLVAKEDSNKAHFKQVMKNPNLYIYLGIKILLDVITGSVLGYDSLFLVNENGITEEVYGFISAGTTLFECIFILIGKKFLNKDKAIVALFIGAIFNSIKMFAFSFSVPAWALISLSVLKGVANGITIAYGMDCIANFLGLDNVTSSVFVIAIGSYIVKFFTDSIAGVVIEKISFITVYRYYSIYLFIITLIIIFVLYILSKKKIININLEKEKKYKTN